MEKIAAKMINHIYLVYKLCTKIFQKVVITHF